MVSKKKTAIILLLTLLAFGLRFYRAEAAPLKDEENNLVKAAAYVYYCQKDDQSCRHQPQTVRSKLIALVTGNETIPNSLAEVYLWDFIKDKASNLHQSRAWPHLYAVAAVYRLLGISELSSRLVSVIAGSLLVVAGYWLSRTFGSSTNLSLLFSALLAVSFPLIDFSRNARMYSLYSLVFLLLVGLIYRRRFLLAGPMFLLAYWLQLVTLILPVALLVWGLRFLLLGLLGIVGLGWWLGVDFFHRYFLEFSWPPHWQYLGWWWLAAIVVLILKKQKYLLSIVGVYFLVLVFFSRPAPAAAYTIMLWPLALWAFLSWRRWLAGLITVFVVFNFISHIQYLYLSGDGRPQIPLAYAAIKDNFQPEDKIYAVQLRDYYLQELPPETEVIDLQANPDPEFSGSGFVVWEEEKTRHLRAETLEYIRANFKHLSTNGVEIYSFGK